MSAEQDAGKSGKKLATLLVLGGIILSGGGYILFTLLSDSDSNMQSVVNINSATNGGVRSINETPHYRELLRADNERGAAAAARNNQTFIASLPQGLDGSPSRGKQQETADTTETHSNRQDTGTPQEDRVVSEKRMERLQKLITRISAQHPAGGTPTTAAAMWNKPQSDMTAQNGTRQFALQNASLSTPAAEKGIQLIPALTRIPAYIDTAVDSDNPSSRVIATIPSGPWAGAKLFSPGVKLVGNGVEIHFDRMSWNGMNLKVNAYAQREDNLMSSVASNVNTRWFKHIVLPSVLGGVGDIGTLYKDANTQVIQGNYGTVTGRVGMPDGEAVAGVIAGGIAEKGSQILTRQAESEPYKQVEVYQHEVVSILFVDPVMTNDAGSSSLSSDISPSVNRTSYAGQRSQARVQAAMEQRKAVMQRRYDEQPETP
ncbi:conjugal transfer protein TraO [Salmonella enterica subsp. enterica serovar 4,[5],12:b:-]|nr:conjugal transfer protein TraO [Salmonella enterica subsp. enterica serovar 4,[5],12:b:-]